jgi:glyoxylase-like metal-dependent hydrolase (beta-lactamase superfamily II)
MMGDYMQVFINQAAVATDPEYDSLRDDNTSEITPHIAYKRLLIVNVAFYGIKGAGDKRWVLIDTGIPGSAGSIMRAARRRFGQTARPVAIIMTHGHFDHSGSLRKLVESWETPVYVHELEFPYLNGTRSYPPPDPAVGGGLMSLLSPLYPRGPIDVSRWLRPLPDDGTVPGMPDWRWIHTPGHTPGHISLWHDLDRLILAGDAFITTQQESAYAVATQRPELHGPPMYYTQDWNDASISVQALAALDPEVVVTGHGPALRGSQMRVALHELARNFNTVAIPPNGRNT